jgi:hypothetical protein
MLRGEKKTYPRVRKVKAHLTPEAIHDQTVYVIAIHKAIFDL